MSAMSWLAVALASLAGSAHCAAMCGGFVAAYASGERTAPGPRVLAHIAYNGGRLLTYAALGATAGALGRALDLAGAAAGIADAAAIVTGVLLLLWGAKGLAPRPLLIRLQKRRSSPLTSRIAALFAGFAQKPALVRAGLLGLSTTLLPCGWLYAFVALAAASGSAGRGAWLMSAFWVGSLPMMLGVGWSLQGIARRVQNRLPRLRSALVLVAGALTLLMRLQLPSFSASPSGAAELPSSADCPCHKGHQSELLREGSDGLEKSNVAAIAVAP